MTTLALFPNVVSHESTDAQCTPRDLAVALGTFDTDPCTNPRSHIAARVQYMLERGEDGLSLPWSGVVYCNPPYSDPLPWAQRLRAHDDSWVALVKLDPTTQWWRELMAACGAWAPFRKRLRFEKPGNVGSADFPCALVWRDWHPSAEVNAMLWEAM